MTPARQPAAGGARKRAPPRKPPGRRPGRPHAFDDVLAGQAPDVRAVAERLRHIVRAAVPDAEERVHGGGKVKLALYHLDDPDNVVCGIQPGGPVCRFFMQHVQDLDDVPFALEGRGRGNRHVKFARVDELDEPALRRVLRQVAAIVRG